MSKFFQVEISSQEDAMNACKKASYAAYISAAITTIFALIAIYNGGSILSGFIDGWILIDAILIFVLGYFVGKYSRTASVILLAYFLFSQIVMRMEAGNIGGMGIALIFGFFYTMGIRGAFYLYNNSDLDEETNESSTH